MSPCETCGHGVSPAEIPEPQDKGHFKEKWTCSLGHLGFVEGQEQDPPSQWNKYGPAFEEY